MGLNAEPEICGFFGSFGFAPMVGHVPMLFSGREDDAEHL
jgi:hypothetical protein